MAAHAECHDNWITHVSVEDDAGFIHEIELPSGGMSETQILRLIDNRFPPRPLAVQRDTLADMLVVMLLGFLTLIVLNAMFGPKNIQPREILWCVYSMSRGCLAEIG
jgi:hypothetical protein